jgi:hypothetical protein
MRTISFSKEALNITTRNLYPSLELTPLVYCSNGTTCQVFPSQQTDIGVTVKADFRIDSEQEDFKGAFLYKLQRKYATRTDNRSNNDTASIEDTVTNMYLLVTWNILSIEYHYHHFYVCLLECTEDFTWDEDKLWALRHQYNSQLYEDYNYLSITWLMDDGAMIKTSHDIAYGLDCELDIIVSEGAEKYHMYRPIKIDPKRLVLSLSMLLVLTYTVSLNIPLSFKLSIHNQCLDVDLVSPTYINTNRSECHRPPKYKVHAGDTMRSAFTIESSDVSAGALIYKIQRKQTCESTEIGKDISSTAHLLVIWEAFRSKLYIDMLSVVCDKNFDWEKDNLEELYCNNSNRFRWSLYSTTETWSLDDNVALRTTFKIMNEDRMLDMTISEGKRDNYARTPAYIDLKR